MNVPDIVYTTVLVAANMGTAGVMYALGNPVFTVILAVVGLVVLGTALLASPQTSRSGSTTRELSS